MERIGLAARPDWRDTAAEAGFTFHSENGPYWDETAAYRFTLAQVEEIEEATESLESLCYQVVDRAVGDPAVLDRLAIPRGFHDLVRRSWTDRERNLYGRFDFSYDGGTPPKLLEYNADTPTSLYEAAVFQWVWLEQMIGRGALPRGSDQFNSLHERLVESWKGVGVVGDRLHLAGVMDAEEDRVTVAYLADCARQAGFATEEMDVAEIGVTAAGDFVDLRDRPIRTLFKLYPWEFMVREQYAASLLRRSTRFIEPAWKMILSNKGLLALLWEMFPGHPNLLPAFFDGSEHGLAQPFVRKPLLSREGANVEIVGLLDAEDGPYGAEGYVVQQYAPLPRFDGNYPVIGSWVVAGQPAGMGIREDTSPVTRNTSRFIPHFIQG
ncbi:glutathionylspermidine synthase family protein [Skermanella mucosa]|uniref:glutathionylspermidine synthase family protein n=1 Tax=Skermanella mucosa TaxID=1789672 RepID=UPI00192AFC65|nr:glutathionylspermidine synthase family protein [Skermanella mucosa]UEM21805.1 glutathionylspermidine synthase family protein [Skermanella mucosa]